MTMRIAFRRLAVLYPFSGQQNINTINTFITTITTVMANSDSHVYRASTTAPVNIAVIK